MRVPFIFAAAVLFACLSSSQAVACAAPGSPPGEWLSARCWSAAPGAAVARKKADRSQAERLRSIGSDFRSLIAGAADASGVPADLILAVIAIESGGAPRAVSPKGAQGLMQLMPATARTVGVADPFDPTQNIRGGARWLRRLLTEFPGDVKLALAAYNAGSGAVRRHGGIPPYRETQDYVRRVLAARETVQALGGARWLDRACRGSACAAQPELRGWLPLRP